MCLCAELGGGTNRNEEQCRGESCRWDNCILKTICASDFPGLDVLF